MGQSISCSNCKSLFYQKNIQMQNDQFKEIFYSSDLGKKIFFVKNKIWEKYEKTFNSHINKQLKGNAQYKKMKNTINGIIYQGHWDNCPNGYGKVYFNNEKEYEEYYQGQFKAGKINGYGIFILFNGDFYIGQFKNNMCHGKGTYESNQFIFNGQWNDSNIIKGQFLFNNENKQFHKIIKYEKTKWKIEYKNKNQYDGELDEQFLRPHGYGTMTIQQHNEKYIGNFQKGNLHGKGKYYWLNGTSYQGNYQNGKKHGYGVFNYSKARRYEGNWIEGQREGAGKIIQNEKIIQNGIYKNNNLIKSIRVQQSEILFDKKLPVKLNELLESSIKQDD